MDEDGDGDVDAEEQGRDMEAWERAYAEDRSWESLTEDASGLLVPVNVTEQQRHHRRRFAAASSGPRIQRGIIRYLFLVLDFSRVSTVLLPALTNPSSTSTAVIDVLLIKHPVRSKNPSFRTGV